jgi:hypothetical protein
MRKKMMRKKFTKRASKKKVMKIHTKSRKLKKSRKLRFVTIKGVTRDILISTSTPKMYSAKARSITKRNIGSRTIRSSVLKSRISDWRIDRAIFVTLQRKSRRFVGKKRKKGKNQ